MGNNLVSWTSIHQTIDGFGAGEAETQGDGNPDDGTITAAQADFLWTTTSGIGLNIIRCLVPGDLGDGGVLNGPSIQLAANRGALVECVPASPPAMYKDNGSLRNGGSLIGPGVQNDGGLYAQWLLDYKNALFSTYGVTLYALSVQNEPDQNRVSISAVWTDVQFHDFIKNQLGPKFAGSGVLLMLPETSCWDCLSSFADTTMNDLGAASFISALVAHDYDEATDAQSQFGKKLWMSEWFYGSGGGGGPFLPYDGTMTAALVVAQKVHDLLTIANVNAFIYWKATNPTGDLNNCLICGTNKPRFAYALGNFSKFVRPGWVRLDCNATWCGPSATNNSGVFVSVYKNTSSGAFTIVAINSNSSNAPIALTFSGFTSSTVTPHITDPTHSLADLPAISAGSGLSYTMPPQSVVTFTGTNGS